MLLWSVCLYGRCDRLMCDRIPKVMREKEYFEKLHLIARVVKKEREWLRTSLPIHRLKERPLAADILGKSNGVIHRSHTEDVILWWLWSIVLHKWDVLVKETMFKWMGEWLNRGNLIRQLKNFSPHATFILFV